MDLPETASTAGISRSGIATTSDGQRHIPSSTRADGSKRREIKIRPGYRPPEDVEVYKNRTAEAWKTRGSGGVPGATSAEDDITKIASSNKNAKRREARKKAKAAAEDEKGGINSKKDEGKPLVASTEGAQEPVTDSVAADTEQEKDKKIKRLKKKLREARDLQAKREKGEGLLQEQFEKVIKINELMRDLEKLGIQDDAGLDPA